MKYLKLFNEARKHKQWGDPPEYYVQSGKGADELRYIKTNIVNSMSPPMWDVWVDLDEYMLDLMDKYKDNIDFTGIDLSVNIPGYYSYHIASEGRYDYRRGERTLAKRDDKNRQIYTQNSEYGWYKAGDIYNTLSTYGSEFDQKFFDYYNKLNGKLYLYYEFLIGAESEFIKDLDEKQYNDLVFEIRDAVKYAVKKLGGKIIKVEQYDSNKKNNWEEVSIDNVDCARLNVSFRI